MFPQAFPRHPSGALFNPTSHSHSFLPPKLPIFPLISMFSCHFSPFLDCPVFISTSVLVAVCLWAERRCDTYFYWGTRLVTEVMTSRLTAHTQATRHESCCGTEFLLCRPEGKNDCRPGLGPGITFILDNSSGCVLYPTTTFCSYTECAFVCVMNDNLCPIKTTISLLYCNICLFFFVKLHNRDGNVLLTSNLH